MDDVPGDDQPIAVFKVKPDVTLTGGNTDQACVIAGRKDSQRPCKKKGRRTSSPSK